MDVSITWSGENVYPQYKPSVEQAVTGEIVKRAGSVRGAAALKHSWDRTGQPARSPWVDVVNKVAAAAFRVVPATVFLEYRGIKIEFIGR